MTCPQLHIYIEGYGDKWAIPAPVVRYPNVADLFSTFEAFMAHCNITQLNRRKLIRRHNDRPAGSLHLHLRDCVTKHPMRSDGRYNRRVPLISMRANVVHAMVVVLAVRKPRERRTEAR
jgi:hypothetical protein